MASYNISILEIGYDTAFPAGIAFDMWSMADKQIYSSFSMTLIQGEGKNILFDCGIDPAHPYCAARIAMENDQGCRNPEEVLASVGLTPNDIDVVVLSHAHWDHIQGLSFFPNAKVYVQAAEVESWKRVLADPDFPNTHKSVIETGALELIEKRHAEGTVEYLNGDVDELLPGINVRVASGHSFAQNMLFIDNDGEKFAIIGDVALRNESFEINEVFKCFLPNLKFAVGTVEEITTSYRKILDWVGGDISRIVMSHDAQRVTDGKAKMTELGLHVTEIA